MYTVLISILSFVVTLGILVTVHEFGHFMGLGHQFKENIIPAQPSYQISNVSGSQNFSSKKLNTRKLS